MVCFTVGTLTVTGVWFGLLVANLVKEEKEHTKKSKELLDNYYMEF